MRLSGGHALRAQRTAPTMITPFEAKTHFLPLGFCQAARLGTVITARTASGALGYVNVEGLDPIAGSQSSAIGTRLCGPNDPPAFVLGLLDPPAPALAPTYLNS